MFHDFYLARCLQQRYVKDRLRQAERERLIELSRHRGGRATSWLGARVAGLARLLRQRVWQAFGLAATDYVAQSGHRKRDSVEPV